MPQGKTFVNGTIGSLVTTISYLVPVLNLFAPVFGGVMAGYLQKEGAVGGMKVGVVKGFIMVAPGVILGTIAAGILADIPVIGGALASSLVAIIFVIVLHSLALGWLGGLIGGAIAGEPTQKNTSTSNQSPTSQDRDSSSVPSQDSQSDRDSSTPNSVTERSNQRQDEHIPSEQSAEPSRSNTTSSSRREVGSQTAHDHNPHPGHTQPEQSQPDNQRRTSRQTFIDQDGFEKLAEKLGTDNDPQSVTSAVEDLVEAFDTVVHSVDNPTKYGIRRSETVIERSTRLAEAIRRDELELSGEATTPDFTDSLQELRNAVRQTRQRNTVDGNVASQLLEDLDSLDNREEDQLRLTLTDAVAQLEQYQQFQTTLNSISLHQEPHQLGDELTRAFDNFNSENVQKLTEVGTTLQSTADDARSHREDYEQLLDVAETICDSAKAQTAISVEARDTQQAVNQLVTELERGSVWFADDTTGISEVAISVQSKGKAESKPAREFLQALQNTHSLPNNQLEETIMDAVEAIDQTETITTRLDGVDPDSLVHTIDRLQSNIDRQNHDLVAPLIKRLEDLKQTAQRANDSDLMTLYAARQELRYYDRTLIPQLSAPEETVEEVQALDKRINTVNDRRTRMRQSYPSEYPDCDHTIPIYFFDLVTTLLEAATELQRQGDQKQAAGVVNAAGQTLDWIEGLYETHSYFVLLKELRG